MKIDEIKERMHSEKLYYCNVEGLVKQQTLSLELLYDFNMTRPSEVERRAELLKQMFCEIGKNCYIEPPLHTNWGGNHVHFKDGVYANFNLTLVDDTHIYVGNHVLFGPNVTVVAGTHPIHPGIRMKQAQYNVPVHIEDNVWIGANSVILPGVTIGQNSVIGAGSVVNKDIPANVVAVGSPCRVLRNITKEDELFYHTQQHIDID